MNIKVINEELGIVSCSKEQILEGAFASSTLIFFYYPKRNWIVFNEDHRDYALFLEFVQGYLELEDYQRKVFLDQVDVESLCKAFAALDLILRIRRNRRKENRKPGCGNSQGANIKTIFHPHCT